ncbi:MAG: hypothetical protein Q7L55_00865 [Actinomycetota bacterium]|nr:hypothetical protein [Actinomycetota bacterium]
MRTAPRFASVTLTVALAAAIAAGTAPAALAAPGDWTQVSQISSATRYPAVANIAEPTIAWFGSSLQVIWPQKQSSSKEAYSTAILGADGRITTAARPVFAEWDTITKNPTLISLGGQRFLSFSGLNAGRTGAQYFANSGDGVTWDVSTGSMSETQSAYASYGSDAIDNAGTPVWVGNPGTTTGIRWHVGTSPSNPAPAGSDGKYSLAGCCGYDAAAARDEATGGVYAAFYSNSSATTENGVQVGQILPGSTGWRQAPGSAQIENGHASSSDPDQQIAMVGRPGGGVYAAYGMGYPTKKAIRILNVITGATLDLPRTSGVSSIALSAEPDGRLWMTWREGTKVMAVHTNAAATRLGAVGNWGAPGGTENLWKSAIAGASGGASIVFTATTQNAINVWHTQVTRTLSVTAAPSSVRRGGHVTFTVTDAGDPVAGAQVRFGARNATTNAAGKATISAPGSRGRVQATARKGVYNPGTTSVRVR